ncbi:MAG TPA: hypothetical protein VHP33_31545 [Polyangiaceae bacterium]|nr:hypothetical protein [Polyangiaceae bacterium]
MGRQLKGASFGGVGVLVSLVVAVSCGSIDPSPPGAEAGAAGDPSSGGTEAGAESGGTKTGGAPTEGGRPAAGEGGGGGVPEPVQAAQLLPWKAGNSWTYRITKAGKVTEKTTVVGDEEVVGGVGPNQELWANHVTTDKGQNDHTESWQAPSPLNPLRISRFREQAFAASTGVLDNEVHYSPEKLHVDGSPEHTVKGASWLETYEETTLIVGLPPSSHAVQERWTVLEDDGALEVPAGTFEGVIHLRKQGNSTKDYWYVRGVGKLKETGTQTEELVEYSLEP